MSMNGESQVAVAPARLLERQRAPLRRIQLYEYRMVGHAGLVLVQDSSNTDSSLEFDSTKPALVGFGPEDFTKDSRE